MLHACWSLPVLVPPPYHSPCWSFPRTTPRVGPSPVLIVLVRIPSGFSEIHKRIISGRLMWQDQADFLVASTRFEPLEASQGLSVLSATRDEATLHAKAGEKAGGSEAGGF